MRPGGLKTGAGLGIRSEARVKRCRRPCPSHQHQRNSILLNIKSHQHLTSRFSFWRSSAHALNLRFNRSTSATSAAEGEQGVVVVAHVVSGDSIASPLPPGLEEVMKMRRVLSGGGGEKVRTSAARDRVQCIGHWKQPREGVRRHRLCSASSLTESQSSRQPVNLPGRVATVRRKLLQA